ncbi:unnamed protein product [Boreogadus saida]
MVMDGDQKDEAFVRRPPPTPHRPSSSLPTVVGLRVGVAEGPGVRECNTAPVPGTATPPPQDRTFLILVQDILDLRDCLLFEHHTTYRPSISSTHKERRPQGLRAGMGMQGCRPCSLVLPGGTDSGRNPEQQTETDCKGMLEPADLEKTCRFGKIDNRSRMRARFME